MKLTSILTTFLIKTLLALFCIASPPFAQADLFKLDSDHSSISFKIRHLVARTQGKFTQFAGEFSLDPKNLKTLEAKATIETKSVDTDNAKRDEHLRSGDFFNVEKFPQMTFVSKKITVKGKTQFILEGDLTLLGITQPVSLTGEFTGIAVDPWKNTRAGFTAQTKLNRKAFGMSWNKALDTGGVLLGEDVEITLEIEGIKSVISTQ